MADPSMKDRVEAFGKAWDEALDGFGRAAESFNAAGGVAPGAIAIAAVRRTLSRLVRTLRRWLPEALSELPGIFNDLISDATETLTTEVPAILESLADLAGDALEAAISALLGLFEMIKKLIYLITDYIDRTFPKNGLTDLIRLQLDLINNLLGQLAELMSPKLGQTARRLKRDMYDQLTAIRVAEGAIPQRPVGKDEEAAG